MKTLIRTLCVLFVGICFVASPVAASAQAPAASPAASPAKKPRNPPYRGNIDTADASAKTFTIKGKKNTRTFTVTPTTKLLKRAGGDAAFEDLKTGEYVTGSAKKTGENAYEALSVKVGPKPEPAASAAASPASSPGSTPAPTKKSRKKAAAAATAASPAPAQ